MDDMAEKIQALLNDEESMRQIKELAEMFGASQSAEPPPADPASSGEGAGGISDMFDPVILMQVMDVFSRSDPYCELITALRPFLSEDKQLKADRAVKMLRLYNVYTALKEKGVLGDII